MTKLVSLLIVASLGHVNAKAAAPKSCLTKLGGIKGLKTGGVEFFESYLECLKAEGEDMHPQFVFYLTMMAKKATGHGEVLRNCGKLIAKDGCDKDFSGHAKAMYHKSVEVTSGDLCRKTCVTEAGEKKSCLARQGGMQGLKTGGVEFFQSYMKCLKEEGQDMHPQFVFYLTMMAKRATGHGEVLRDCGKLIAKDGCNEDFSGHAKAMYNKSVEVTSGDLCRKTCVAEDGKKKCCLARQGGMMKVKTGAPGAEFMKSYMKCLVEEKQDMHPHFVSYLTSAAKAVGGGQIVSHNCAQLIFSDGCDKDYSSQAKTLFKEEMAVASADLCAKTCDRLHQLFE